MCTALKYVLCASLVITVSGCTTFLDIFKSDPIDVDPTERTFGAWWDDQSIETTVAHNIAKSHPDLDKAHVEVDSFNGVVLLTGEVPTPEARTLASEVAMTVPNVRIVHNELAIRGNTSLLARSDDTFTHKRIKLRHYGDDRLNGVNIDVIVEDSVAYLMGLVTREQGEVAANITSLTRGVRQVVKVFEYVD